LPNSNVPITNISGGASALELSLDSTNPTYDFSPFKFNPPSPGDHSSTTFNDIIVERFPSQRSSTDSNLYLDVALLYVICSTCIVSFKISGDIITVP